MKTRIGLFFLLFICSLPLSAQLTVNVNDLFKMHLFLERRLFADNDLNKNDDLYSFFSDHTSISPNLLNSELIGSDYHFYRINLKDDIKFHETLYSSTDHKDFFGVIYGFNEDYILCVDHKSGQSYRIQGFDGNDFLDFLEDYCERERISVRNFLHWRSVEGIDFKCLYRALRSKERNRDKYPCLQRVSDPIRIH